MYKKYIKINEKPLMLLDKISVRPVLVYSLKKLKRDYTGSSVNVRRSSDNKTLDVGFNRDGSLNTASLLSFCGTGNGFVVTWYDQSGNGSNATQATTANQPQIVTSGVVNTRANAVSLNFNGTSQYLQLTNPGNIDGYSQMSMSCWWYPTIADGIARAMFSKRSASNVNESYASFLLTSNNVDNDFNGTATRFASAKVFTINSWYQTVLTFDGTLTTANRSKFYVNNALDKTSTQSSATVGSNASDLFIGTLNSADGRWFAGSINELIIFKNALSSDDMTKLYRNQNSYYGTP